MRKMKKISAFILGLAIIVSLTACSGGNTGKTETGKTETANVETEKKEKPKTETGESTEEAKTSVGESSEGKTIETTFWTDFLVDESVFTNAIASFTSEYPQYKINFEKFPGSDRAQKLALAKQSKTLPSLLFVASFTCMDEVHQGSILPVTQEVGLLGDDILKSSLEPSIINGENYMFPLFQSYFGLLYNADIFRAAGLDKFLSDDETEIATWALDEYENEILPALKTYVAGTEKYPMALFAGNNQADTHNNSFLRMYGGTVFQDGKAVAGSDENTIKALDKLYEWYQKGYTNSDVVTKLSTECMGDFKNQKVGICFGQYTNYASIHSDFEAGNLEKFDVRIATIPKKEDGKDTSTIASYIYGAMLMNVDEDQQKAAKDFLAWMVKNKDTVLTSFNTCGIPVVPSISEKEGESNPLYAQYAKADQFVYDFTGGVPGYVETRAFLFPAIQSCISGEKSGEDALKEFDQRSNKVIEEYTKRSVVLSK